MTLRPVDFFGGSCSRAAEHSSGSGVVLLLLNYVGDIDDLIVVKLQGSGREVHHPTVLHSVNLSQLHQRRVRDRFRFRNRVRDRDRLSVKQLGGELLHQRRYKPNLTIVL